VVTLSLGRRQTGSGSWGQRPDVARGGSITRDVAHQCVFFLGVKRHARPRDREIPLALITPAIKQPINHTRDGQFVVVSHLIDQPGPLIGGVIHGRDNGTEEPVGVSKIRVAWQFPSVQLIESVDPTGVRSGRCVHPGVTDPWQQVYHNYPGAGCHSSVYHPCSSAICSSHSWYPFFTNFELLSSRSCSLASA